jgi:hypothetical protein
MRLGGCSRTPTRALSRLGSRAASMTTTPGSCGSGRGIGTRIPEYGNINDCAIDGVGEFDPSAQTSTIVRSTGF